MQFLKNTIVSEESNSCKTNILLMHQIYHNDQAFIAEEYLYLEGHIEQTARLAFFKINSYKLSLINSAFCMTRDELTGSIRSSLLNYTQPSSILAHIGFFVSETEN